MLAQVAAAELLVEAVDVYIIHIYIYIYIYIL